MEYWQAIKRFFQWRKFFKVQVILDIFLWLAVFMPVLYLFILGTPAERGFFCDDESLSYPYKQDTVSNHTLIAAVFTTSFCVLIFVEILNTIERRCLPHNRFADDMFYCVKAYSIFLVGFVVQELVVDVVKNQMGNLRPNFFDVCRPQFNRSHCPGYITEFTCTGSEEHHAELKDVRQSFPSGHSAISMYTAVYFTIYIQRRLFINFSAIFKFLTQAGLLSAAFICGLSRISDNKHHPRDVIVGFAIGFVVAISVSATVGRTLKHSVEEDNETYTDDMSKSYPAAQLSAAKSSSSLPPVYSDVVYSAQLQHKDSDTTFIPMEHTHTNTTARDTFSTEQETSA